jgi:hypothetical protein
MMDSNELEEQGGRGSKNNDGKQEATTARDNDPQPAPS